MDRITRDNGELYERFMLLAYNLTKSNPVVGADRRHYYLLYIIRNGIDLRETGYDNQLLTIRTYISNGISNLLEGELHGHERDGLHKAFLELEAINDEESLSKLINKLLRVIQRFELQ